MRVIAFITFLLSAPTLFAESPISDPLVLKSATTTIKIPQQGPDGPKDWHSLSCSGGGDIGVLHAAIRRGDTLYVLFTLAGWSRGAPSDRGRCGSGWETQMNWMKIKGGIVIAHQQRDLESCWRDAFGSIEGWRGSRLLWTTDERDGEYQCFFDSLQPERGIQTTSFTVRPTDAAEQGAAAKP